LEDKEVRLADATTELSPQHSLVDTLPPNVPVVEFDDVHLQFDENKVLQGVSFRVERGETRVILGPAGVGKSVLIKLANGLLVPDSGAVRVFGKDLCTLTLREMFELRAHVGMVFQESALFDSLNVEDNVAYRLHEEHMPEAEIHEQVVEALRFVELEKAIDKFPSELSGGMRRRVSIARAIISKPDLILYDSPTGGLDPITSNTIIELVVKQRDVSRTTSLLITHRLQDAFTMATHRWNPEKGCMEKMSGNELDERTKFLVLNEGNVVFDGATRELTRTQDPWLKEFLE
jgi:phospholipid/cholesterol/gamma-HCH transport system ATP-binding protein